MKRIVAVLIVALMFVVVPAQAATEWSWFERTSGLGNVYFIKVKSGCMNTKEKAAHLKLLRYGDGHAVYGCSP